MNHIKSDEFTPILDLHRGVPTAIEPPAGQKRGLFNRISIHFPGSNGHKYAIGQPVFVKSNENLGPYIILTAVRTLKIAELTCNDALALGVEGAGPLEKLKSLLRKRFKENVGWQNGNTEIDILTFEFDG